MLAWAVEDATPDEAAIAFTRWSSHRPEELWWLFQQIDRDGGEWDSPKTGWRIAIRHALIRDGEDAPKANRRPRPATTGGERRLTCSATSKGLMMNVTAQRRLPLCRLA